jgi:hypothetical protein
VATGHGSPDEQRQGDDDENDEDLDEHGALLWAVCDSVSIPGDPLTQPVLVVGVRRPHTWISGRGDGDPVDEAARQHAGRRASVLVLT